MDEWAAILERHRPLLLARAALLAPAVARAQIDAEDLVQQTILEALRERERLAGRPDHEVAAFLVHAQGNNAIDAARRYARHRADVSADAVAETSTRINQWFVADQSSPSERASRAERFAALAEALARLPEGQRVAVMMRYLQGENLAAIARVLGTNENAVSQLLFRAIAALRRDRAILDS